MTSLYSLTLKTQWNFAFRSSIILYIGDFLGNMPKSDKLAAILKSGNAPSENDLGDQKFLQIRFLRLISPKKVVCDFGILKNVTHLYHPSDTFDRAFDYSFWPFDRERIMCVRWSLWASRGCPKMQFFLIVSGGLLPPLDEPPRLIVFWEGARAKTSPKIDDIAISAFFANFSSGHKDGAQYKLSQFCSLIFSLF